MTIGDIIDREVEEAVEKAVEKAVENTTRSTKVDDILELLEDADGDVSDALKERISAMTDPEQLKTLHKFAAKAESVAEFEKRMKEME